MIPSRTTTTTILQTIKRSRKEMEWALRAGKLMWCFWKRDPESMTHERALAHGRLPCRPLPLEVLAEGFKCMTPRPGPQ
eukprot:scaffold112173_cov56-Attheya_sp.AAC.1